MKKSLTLNNILCAYIEIENKMCQEKSGNKSATTPPPDIRSINTPLV